MVFSLLLPTRQGPDLVHRLLESLASTTDRPDRVEIVLYVDTDDRPSQGIDHEAFSVVKLIRPRATMGVMTQECYEASSGRYLMLLNDDVLFRTAGWDTAVRETFARFSDDIALVWGNDLFRRERFPSHPFLSRRFCTIAGGPCPPEYVHDYIDTHLFDLFRILKRAGHDRMVYLPAVVFEHCCRDAGKALDGDARAKPHSAADLQTYIAWAEQRERIAADLAVALARAQEARAPRPARTRG